jgi:ACS family tartrate transporter-like MFS transporter
LLNIHWLGYSGWRWLLLLEGVPAVIAGFVAMFYLTDRPRDAGWLSDDERAWITGELDREAGAKQDPGTSVWQSFWRVFQNRDVILLTAVYFLGSCAQYGFTFWLPKIIQRLSGLQSFEVSLIAALPFLASWPAMLLLSWSSDRTGERRWHTAAAYIALAAGLAGSMWTGGGMAFVLVMFSLAGIGINARLPAFWALPASLLGGATAAASIGAINCIGNLGGLVGPWVLGVLSTDTGGYTSGIWCLAGASVLAAVVILLVRAKPSPQKLS